MGIVPGRSTRSLDRMSIDRAPLIPPKDVPAAQWSKPSQEFRWRMAIVGVLVGALVAVGAHFLGWSAWVWLAVPAGLLLGYVSAPTETNAMWSK